ncbi:hypothetical protein HV356_15895 [Citrobacter sp. RHBSTW-01065]|nr:hypothetical protein [Citrobacter sp. RHBSTW-01065]
MQMNPLHPGIQPGTNHSAGHIVPTGGPITLRDPQKRSARYAAFEPVLATSP